MNKILLVTGATSDVGIRLINRIYSEYDLIYAHYRYMNGEFEKMLASLLGKTEIIPIKADFLSMDDVNKMTAFINKDGRVPNNIVHLPSPPIYNQRFHKDDWENFDLGWQISVRSIALITKAFIPVMSKEKYGRIVFMLTSNTINNPAKYQSSYVTVKYALLGLMKSLSVEYADKGITVNGVSPDMMETKFLKELPELIVAQNAKNSPIGRNIYPEEVIEIIVCLMSDSSASITGQNIGITGGL